MTTPDGPTVKLHDDRGYAARALGIAWGAWCELGVSGWTATHQDWAVDPEPLIIFTSVIADDDPRLRDEATDWCIQNWRYVSKARLKNLARSWPGLDRSAFGEFTATVGEHVGSPWPDATQPRPYRPTGRSNLPPLDKPSLVWLRMRAMFGLGARAAILSQFLATGSERASGATLSAATGYTKRNIAEEANQLVRAGVLDVRRVGNRFTYGLARRSALQGFVGTVPLFRPSWTAMLRVATAFTSFEREAGSTSPLILPVHARLVLDEIQTALEDLQVPVPSRSLTGAEVVAALDDLGSTLLIAWSEGRWPPTG